MAFLGPASKQTEMTSMTVGIAHLVSESFLGLSPRLSLE